MRTHRFGRKLKLPSTMAIKHGILRMMFQDELKAQTLAAEADGVLVAHGRGASEARGGDVPTGLAFNGLVPLLHTPILAPTEPSPDGNP